MTATEHVILVDLADNPLGTAEKMHAHKQNLCHRAISVFILRKNSGLEILLQQRASSKYHSANLWTNTCCSHPRPGEETLAAAKRRLKEEMSIDAELQALGSFHYVAHFDNGLSENEIDHVFIGFIDDESVIRPNPLEVQDYRWMGIEQLKAELERDEKKFTPWLKQALGVVEGYFGGK